ncbi:MAG: hypothetical protein QNJ63_24700 [Calothrix sp. MO_192.B10]|nr:hypothetical protein [Calothrix sp. MO_192.B10]
MTSLYPISTSARATNYEQCWELAIAGVEYLFMGIRSHDYGDIQEDKGNSENLNLIFNLLSAPSRAKKLKKREVQT